MRAGRQELGPQVLAVVAQRRVRGLSASELAQFLNRSAVPPVGLWDKRRVRVLLAHLAERPGEPFPLELVDGVRPPAQPGALTADTKGRRVDGRRRR